MENLIKMLQTNESLKEKFHEKQVTILGGILKNMLNQLPVRSAEPGNEGWNKNTKKLNMQLANLATRIKMRG